MKHIVTINDVTGAVVSEWRGGDEQSLADRPGHTHLVVTDERSHTGERWTGLAFESMAPTAVDDLQAEQLWRIETKLDELLAK